MTLREFEDSAILTVGQISRLAGITNNRTTIRLLTAGGVRVLRVGRRHVVERLAVRDALPAFYEAVVAKLAANLPRIRDDSPVV
jgi:hypothetical protein